MTALTAFGLAAVMAMMSCYALEKRGAGYILGFSLAGSAASVYGGLAGTWPFGVVEAIWAAIAFRRWLHVRAA